MAAVASAVTGVSPGSGPVPGGTSVTITGSGFTGATAVNFGGTAASSFTVNSDTSITATAPAASAVGPVDVTVTTPSGTSATSGADQYTYIYPFAGYQAPVDNPPTINQVNAGQAIPMQFSSAAGPGFGPASGAAPEPAELACAALLLTDPASSYLTGVILPVDGGWTGRGLRDRSARGRGCRSRPPRAVRPHERGV